MLTVDGRAHETRYSARVVRLLVERKGARRAPLYFPFKEERARLFLDPLLRYLRGRGARDLSVLEVGASFGHMTEYLAEQPEIAEIHCFDTDPAFVDIVRAKVEEQGLRDGQGGAALRQRRDAAAARGPTRASISSWSSGWWSTCPRATAAPRWTSTTGCWRPAATSPSSTRPNRLFPLETHSIGLPLVQWLPPRLAYAYARLARPRKFGAVSYESFVADGTGWRNATLADCLPSGGRDGARRRHRGGGLRLAVLPRHRALPHAAAPCCRSSPRPRRRSGPPGDLPRSACPTSTCCSGSCDPHRDRAAQLSPVPAAAASAQVAPAHARLARQARPHQPRVQRDHLLRRGGERLRPDPPLCRGRAARVSGAPARGGGLAGGRLRPRARGGGGERLLHHPDRPPRPNA